MPADPQLAKIISLSLSWIISTMKTLLVISLIFVCALADQCVEYPASMNSGVSQSTLMYEDFLYNTNNGKCVSTVLHAWFNCSTACMHAILLATILSFFFAATDPNCGRMGCCPKIVTYPASKATVIQPFTGFRGNVAVIVDWGGDPTPCNPYRRRCTTDDGPFVYVAVVDNYTE